MTGIAYLNEELETLCSELTPMEFGILISTNNACFNNEPNNFSSEQTTVLITKQFYYWIAILTLLLKKNSNVTGNDISKAFQHALFNNSQLVYEAYYHLNRYPQLPNKLVESFLDFFDFGESILPKKVISITESAYKSLIDKNLIIDPVTITAAGITVAVLGLVPCSFCQKTKKGIIVSRRINSVLWSYEMSHADDYIEHHFNFRLWKLLRALRVAMEEETEMYAQQATEKCHNSSNYILPRKDRGRTKHDK